MKYKTLLKLYYESKEKAVAALSERKNSELAFCYDFEIKGNQAFVVVNKEIYSLIYSIIEKSKDLQIYVSKIPEIITDSFLKSCLVEELKATNEIEGVRTTKKQIQDVIFNKKKTFSGIYKKYELIKNGENVKLDTSADLRALYDDILLQDIAADDKPDGLFFRKGPVVVVDTALQKETHTGVSGEAEIIKLVEKALGLAKQSEPNALVNIAVFHYLMGYIHPFYDGNGRLARVISSYQLSKICGELVALNLSSAIKSSPKKYYSAFETVDDTRNFGDLTPFAISFLELVLDAINSTREKLETKVAKLDFFIEKIEKLEYNKKLLKTLLEIALFAPRGAAVSELAEMLDMSDVTVRKHLGQIPIELLWKTKFEKFDLYEINLDTLEK